MSIAAALLLTSTAPAVADTRVAAGDDETVFAALVDDAANAAGVATAPASIQTFSTLSPALLAQTVAAGDGTIDPNAAGVLTADVSGAAMDGAADPMTLVTASAGAGAQGKGAEATAVAPQQGPGLIVAAAMAGTTPQPIELTADAEGTTGESGDQIDGEAAAPAGTPTAQVSTASTLLLPTGVVVGAQAPAKGEAAAKPPAVPAFDAPPTTDGPPSEAPDATSAKPAGPASPAQTPNQPATAAAAAQPAATPPADTAAAKADVSAMLATQAAQSPDPVTQAASHTAETARTTPTPAALQSAPAATIQVYNRIIERADGRAQRFEIRLDPAELGRVDVRIEIGSDRKVHAVLAAHDSAALSDLMRGQRALERALADAGIDLGDKGVRFEMARDNGSGGAQQRGHGDDTTQANVWRRFETMTMPATADVAAAVQPSWRPQRLDLVA